MYDEYENYKTPMDDLLVDIEKVITLDSKYKVDILLAFIKNNNKIDLNILENLRERINAMWDWDDGYNVLTSRYIHNIRTLLDKIYANIQANPLMLLESLKVRKEGL